MTDLAKVLYSMMQTIESGGMHTSPPARLLLLSIALLTDAKVIVELGYDAGWTTEVLAQTGAHVIGVDNLSEYPGVKVRAGQVLAGYPNVELFDMDALAYLRGAPDASIDMLFIDDSHEVGHVVEEYKEARRVLRPGGVVCLHDTIALGLWSVVESVFPDWPRLNLPARGPISGRDFGIGIARKPL